MDQGPSIVPGISLNGMQEASKRNKYSPIISVNKITNDYTKEANELEKVS